MNVQSCSRHLERGNRLDAIDSREVGQELIEGVSCFQIVKKVLYRDARCREHGHTALDPGIPLDDWFMHGANNAR